MGAERSRKIGLFRETSDTWNLKTSVGYGASKCVSEEDRGRYTASRFRPAATMECRPAKTRFCSKPDKQLKEELIPSSHKFRSRQPFQPKRH
jgi:hypothetical protein